MDKGMLTSGAGGYVKVRTPDLYAMSRMAHELRQEIGDPRLDHVGRTRYADMIALIDRVINNAGGEDDAAVH